MKKYLIKALVKNITSKKSAMTFYIAKDGIVHPLITKKAQYFAFDKKSEAENYIKKHPLISQDKKYVCEYNVIIIDVEKEENNERIS